MTRFILKRLAAAVFVLVSISILVFLIFFATPGVDPAARIAGRNADQLTLQQVRATFDLDKPIHIRYVSMMKHLFIDRDLTSYVNRFAGSGIPTSSSNSMARSLAALSEMSPCS